jgi:PKD repeat protein
MRNLPQNCLIALFLIAFASHAQVEKGCGFNWAQDKARALFPSYDENLTALQNIAPVSQKLTTATPTIPVVFHILHLNGPENISDAQVQSAVAVLNIDYRKQNSDTTQIVTQFKNLAADVNVEFVLASLDPDGNCTNGITRHYDVHTDWDTDQSYYTYTWPPEKYLNIYVVRSMTQSGAAAYTFLPGTVPPALDAVVSLHDYVGKIGTGSNGKSRTLTHEVGHWLGLQHTWGSTNNPGVACGDDGVNDTPITKGHSFCNLSNATTCNPPIVENIQNYMEYAYCSRMFTIGQSNLMNGILASSTASRSNVVTPANLLATGVTNANYNCAPKPEFISSALYTCEGSQLTFTDFSYNGTVTAWQWSSPAASNISTLQIGTLTFINPGLQLVKLKASNAFGSDSITKPNFVTVMAANGSTVNNVQDFETGTYPNNQWIASIPAMGSGYLQTNTVGASGTKCMYINNFFDNPNGPANLITPNYNLNNVTGAQLSFKYAYAQKGNSADQLFVFVSTDCGQTWTNINTLVGSSMATSLLPVNIIPYVPLSSDFKTQNISLAPYQGNTNVHFRFEFTSDPGGAGNNFYLDDINVSGTVGLEDLNDDKYFVLFPNPAKTNVTIKATYVIKHLSVFDVLGKQIEKLDGSNSKEQTIAISHLSKGIYLVKIDSDKGASFKKLIIE